MPNASFRAYRRSMLPDWLDFDRLQALLVGVTVLAVILALLGLALSRRPAAKVLAVVVFGLIAVGAVRQIQTLDDARRTDCGNVEIFDAGVIVPHCPAGPA